MDITKEEIERKWTVKKEEYRGQYEFHWHPRAEICCIAEGRCDFYVNGVLYEGKKGDVLVFKSGDIHRYVTDKDGADIYVCTFEPSLIYKHFDSFPAPKTYISIEDMKEKDVFDSIISLFKGILTEEEKKEEHFGIIAQARIVELYALLSRHFEASSDNTGTNDLTKFEAFQKILDYISENYASDISLADLAGVINYSVSNVSSMFSRFIDMNFKKYLDNIRVNKAVELIGNDALNVTEIAMKCGFNNVRTFNSVFKSVTGMTPSEMKNRI